MNERAICRNGDNTLQTGSDWDLEVLEDSGVGDPQSAGSDGDDGDWELESLDSESAGE